MTTDEAWGVLASAHTGIFTSLRHDGVPVSLPVWFVALDRRVYLRGWCYATDPVLVAEHKEMFGRDRERVGRSVKVTVR